MKRLVWVVSAALILMAHSAGAESADALQSGLFFNLDFGVRERVPELHFGARLDYSAGLRWQSASRSFAGEVPGDHPELLRAPSHWTNPGLLQLDLSAHRDITLSAGGLPLAGYTHVLRADGAEVGQGGWFARNWGWTLAGVAVVAGAAVAAGGGHGGSGGNTQNANQCQVTVIGSPPTNTTGCPK